MQYSKIVNKVFGNPLVIGVLLVFILGFITFLVFLNVAKPHKWAAYTGIMLLFLLLIPSLLFFYEFNRTKLDKKGSISGGSSSGFAAQSPPAWNDGIFGHIDVNSLL
jgi:protein-S-isoprenylcysteine O-methyltransferase Ste14